MGMGGEILKNLQPGGPTIRCQGVPVMETSEGVV